MERRTFCKSSVEKNDGIVKLIRFGLQKKRDFFALCSPNFFFLFSLFLSRAVCPSLVNFLLLSVSSLFSTLTSLRQLRNWKQKGRMRVTALSERRRCVAMRHEGDAVTRQRAALCTRWRLHTLEEEEKEVNLSRFAPMADWLTDFWIDFTCLRRPKKRSPWLISRASNSRYYK